MDQGLLVDASTFLQMAFRPAVVTWNRLEARPRREDFDRSLKAEVRDPLWMLCRQWQFGEFLGEDGGSAVKAKVQIDSTRINRFAVRGGPSVGYDDTLPLEAEVEREPVPLDLATRIQVGRHWIKLLAGRTTGDHRGLYLGEYGFQDPTDAEALAHVRSDQRGWQMLEVVKGRVVDGAKLLAAIDDGRHDTFVDGSGMSATDKTEAKVAAQLLVEWFARVYSQPEVPEEDAWAPSYLEYQFACSAQADSTGETQSVLVAEGYHHGHLDWYSFDIDEVPTSELEDREGTSIGPGRFLVAEPITFIPNAIEFGGMPNVRWWQFEDRKTDFGNLQASTTDLALLMLAEFGLIYGNDWSLLPYDVEVGSLVDVKGVVVTDVFGVRTFVRPAGRGADDEWQRWSMYNLSRVDEGARADTRMFLPPAVGKLQESSPIESVLLARDEMANMVWGVEETIPGVMGRGVKGFEAATDLVRHLRQGEPPEEEEELVENEAVIQYNLGTTVPENWIPFIAVHEPGSNREIRLQRAALPRLVGADPDAIVRPRGGVLRHGLDLPEPEPYFIHEEEVPRAGALVTRTFQRTRWWDGRVYTWLGRRKRTGRGQGSSGLEFDKIVPKEVG